MHPWRAWPSLSYPTRKGEKVRPLIHSSSEHAGASATLVVANGWCCCLRVAKPPGNAPCAPASRSSYQLGWRLPTRGRHGTATPWPRAGRHACMCRAIAYWHVCRAADCMPRELDSANTVTPRPRQGNSRAPAGRACVRVESRKLDSAYRPEYLRVARSEFCSGFLQSSPSEAPFDSIRLC